jgi:hypothetical protein
VAKANAGKVTLAQEEGGGGGDRGLGERDLEGKNSKYRSEL